jgi:Lon protease-like protein
MAAQETREFPLFPLGIVALPTEGVPLHIFEQRYRTMIEHCLGDGVDSGEHEFGIVWLSDEELKPVGCACAIERVLERLEHGRLNILARGTRPFRLLARQDHLPYPAGVIEFLDEDDEEIDEDTARSAREHYRELVRQATDREISDEELMELTPTAWPRPWSSASRPSRSCSSCARRTRA